MAKLNKAENGLLFYEDFKEKTLVWTLSPSSATNLSFEGDGLHIKHSKQYVTYTIPEPSAEEYSCVVHLTHTPVNYEDVAGVIVLSSTQEYAECQSYLASGPSEITGAGTFKADVEAMVNEVLEDSNYVKWYVNDEPEKDSSANAGIASPDSYVPGTPIEEGAPFYDVVYPYIKFSKIRQKYVFYASHNGYTWIEVGNIAFDNANVIGFFLYGTKDANVLKNGKCVFNSFALYSSKYLSISGIDREYDIELKDKDGHKIFRTDDIDDAYMISRSNKEVLVNTTTLAMPIIGGRIRMYPKHDYDNTVCILPLSQQTYGGDKYILERHIQLSINNEPINNLEIYDLGTFYRGSYYIKVDVYNAEEFILNDIKIKAVKYSEFYGGEEEVVLAVLPTDSELPPSAFTYSKQITIDSIGPSQGRSFFMKLIDVESQGFYFDNMYQPTIDEIAHDCRFKIVIE